MLGFSRLGLRVANDHRQLQETIPQIANSQVLTQVTLLSIHSICLHAQLSWALFTAQFGRLVGVLSLT